MINQNLSFTTRIDVTLIIMYFLCLNNVCIPFVIPQVALNRQLTKDLCYSVCACMSSNRDHFHYLFSRAFLGLFARIHSHQLQILDPSPYPGCSESQVETLQYLSRQVPLKLTGIKLLHEHMSSNGKSKSEVISE